MKLSKTQTETYLITELENLDPVFVYVTNYGPGHGKIVIECYGRAWAAYWSGMGDASIQAGVLDSDNDYLIKRMIQETRQTDFDAINARAAALGNTDFGVTSDTEVAMQAKEMASMFGPDWMMDLPRCNTSEYEYLDKILNAVKAAFAEEIHAAA